MESCSDSEAIIIYAKTNTYVSVCVDMLDALMHADILDHTIPYQTWHSQIHACMHACIHTYLDAWTTHTCTSVNINFSNIFVCVFLMIRCLPIGLWSGSKVRGQLQGIKMPWEFWDHTRKGSRLWCLSPEQGFHVGLAHWRLAVRPLSMLLLWWQHRFLLLLLQEVMWMQPKYWELPAGICLEHAFASTPMMPLASQGIEACSLKFPVCTWPLDSYGFFP